MKKFLSFAIVALSFPAFGAVSFLDSLNPYPSTDEIRVREGEECANFSGSWKGVCMSSGQKIEQAFSINQKGCAVVAVNAGDHQMMIPVGGTIGVNGAIPGAPAMTFGTNIESHWNKKKSALTIQVMGGSKALALDGAPRGFMLQENVRLKDGKLYVDIYAFGSEYKLISFCEFDKQS